MINVEVLLRDYLKKISVGYQDFYCVHICASQFTEDNKKDHKIKRIEDSLKFLAQQNKCRYFHVFNEDFFIFFQEKNKDEVNAALLKIKFYFSDDENIKSNKISLFTFYDISQDLHELNNLVQNTFNHVESLPDTGKTHDMFYTRTETKNISPTLFKEEAKNKLKRKLTPATLSRIENSLKQVDFSSIIRRQSICAIYGKSFPQPLFDEVFVSIVDLQETLMPDIDITSSPWLFKHLTEVLDKGVLLSIGKHDYGSLKLEFSVNLNTATIISSEFGRFDDKINPSVKSTIVLELNPSDIFNDLHTYILARSFAKNKGYKLCLDNMSIDLMKYIDKDRLGIDMIKLFWSPKFMDEVTNNKKEVISLIRKFGEDKVVLARVDDPIAVDIGQSVGISLFQGRHINTVLSSDPRKRRVGSVIMHK